MNLMSKNTIIAALATIVFVDEVIISKINKTKFSQQLERNATLHNDLDRVWHLVLHYQTKMDQAGVELDETDQLMYKYALPTV